MDSAANIRPGDTVKAISLWEPWATLMAFGAKTIETRSWMTRHRGALLICAGLKGDESTKTIPEFAAALGGDWADWQLNFGCAVALVDLDGCIGTRTAAHHRPLAQAIEAERPFGDYSPQRFCWVTKTLRRLKPFPVTGRQGLFSVEMPGFEDWSR